VGFRVEDVGFGVWYSVVSGLRSGVGSRVQNPGSRGAGVQQRV